MACGNRAKPYIESGLQTKGIDAIRYSFFTYFRFKISIKYLSGWFPLVLI